MNTAGIAPTLALLFDELVDGAKTPPSYMLNGGDAGLLRSLDRLSAAEASAAAHDGAPVSAHVDHLRYGLSLMNRWAAGEDAFRDADWGRSWQVSAVSDADWKKLRADLASEAQRWRATLGTPRNVEDGELNFMVASVAHLAYHLGAIRQIARVSRGPADGQ